MSYTTTSIVSSTPMHPSIGWNNAWVTVANNADRELYAQAVHVVNFDDIHISLSAGDINIDKVSIKDPNNASLQATIDSATQALNVHLTNSNYATDSNQQTEILLLSAQADGLNALSSILTLQNTDIISFLSAVVTEEQNITTLLRNLSSLNTNSNTDPVTSIFINNITRIPAYPVVKEWGVVEVDLPKNIEVVLPNRSACVASIINYTGDVIKIKNTAQDVYFQILNNFAFDINVVNNINEITLLQTTSSANLTLQIMYTNYV